MLLGSSGDDQSPSTNVFGLSNASMRIDSPKGVTGHDNETHRNHRHSIHCSGLPYSPVNTGADNLNVHDSNGSAHQAFNNNTNLSSLVMDFITQSDDNESTIIDLSHRSIDIRALTLIARKYKPHLRNTLSFKLSFNQLKDIGVQLLVQYASQEKRKIKILDIAFNDVGDAGAEALANATCLDGSLQTLCLSGNRVSQTGFQKLCDTLRHSRTLTSLYCSGNSGKHQGAEYIASILSSRLVPLKVFWFDGNNIQSTGARAISQGLCQNISLEHLNLSNNCIEDAGCEYIASALEKQRHLKDLYLSFNGITATGLQFLANALINYHALTKLDLDNNKIGDDGAEYLTDALGHMSLSILNVAYNNIATRGIQCIVESLVMNPALQYLSLSGNDINIDSGIAIHNLLLYNRTLKGMYIDGQSIGEAGQRQIASSIASNAHGGLLDFSGFSLGPHMVHLGGPAELKDLSNEGTLQYLQKLWNRVDNKGSTTHTHDENTMTNTVVQRNTSDSQSTNVGHTDKWRANMYPARDNGYGFNKMGGPGPYFDSNSSLNSSGKGMGFEDDLPPKETTFLKNIKGMSNNSVHSSSNVSNAGYIGKGSNASSVIMEEGLDMMMMNDHLNTHNGHTGTKTPAGNNNSNTATTENSTRSNSSVELLELLSNIISDSDITNILNVGNVQPPIRSNRSVNIGSSHVNNQSVNLSEGIAINSASDHLGVGTTHLGDVPVRAIADSEKLIEAMKDKHETLGGSRSLHSSHSSANGEDSDDGEGHSLDSIPRTNLLSMSAMPSVNVFSFTTADTSNRDSNNNTSDWDRVLNAASHCTTNTVVDGFANLSEVFVMNFRNISKEPYAASELWELHQYYHSYSRVEESDTASTNTSEDEMDDMVFDRRLVPGSRKTLREGSNRETTISSKRKKKAEARIAKYPRIQLLLDTFKKRNEDNKMLTLLRQLFFLERVKERDLDPGTDIEQLLFHIR